MKRLYGVGEPLTLRVLTGEIDRERAISCIREMGFRSMREWMHITSILSDPETLRADVAAEFKKTLSMLAGLDVEVTGMSHSWFLPDGSIAENEMPERSTGPDSAYQKTLAALEKSWETLAAAFPEVCLWEVGNEWNTDTFLHPIGWKYGDRDFPYSVRMDIAVDMMFHSARGIRKGNPLAKVISFSPCRAPVSTDNDLPYFIPPQYAMAQSLEMVYQRIESGAFGSSCSDDFFDLLAWHPYSFIDIPYSERGLFTHHTAQKMAPLPDTMWKNFSDAAYEVMCKHGDSDKKVLITEFGYTDCFDPETEKKQAEAMCAAFEIADKLPYIYAMHAFRLLEQRSMMDSDDMGTISGLSEVTYGMFTEEYAPRLKARKLHQLAEKKGW